MSSNDFNLQINNQLQESYLRWWIKGMLWFKWKLEQIFGNTSGPSSKSKLTRYNILNMPPKLNICKISSKIANTKTIVDSKILFDLGIQVNNYYNKKTRKDIKAPALTHLHTICIHCPQLVQHFSRHFADMSPSFHSNSSLLSCQCVQN